MKRSRSTLAEGVAGMRLDQRRPTPSDRMAERLQRSELRHMARRRAPEGLSSDRPRRSRLAALHEEYQRNQQERLARNRNEMSMEQEDERSRFFRRRNRLVDDMHDGRRASTRFMTELNRDLDEMERLAFTDVRRSDELYDDTGRRLDYVQHELPLLQEPIDWRARVWAASMGQLTGNPFLVDALEDRIRHTIIRQRDIPEETRYLPEMIRAGNRRRNERFVRELRRSYGVPEGYIAQLENDMDQPDPNGWIEVAIQRNTRMIDEEQQREIEQEERRMAQDRQAGLRPFSPVGVGEIYGDD